MAKGKKFDAAEKHFEKKCVEWKVKIRELERVNKILHKTISDNCNEFEQLQMENEYLKQQNDVLMELKDMNVEDVKTLIKSQPSLRLVWCDGTKSILGQIDRESKYNISCRVKTGR